MSGYIAIACPGVGHIHRGFESFSAELALEVAPLCSEIVSLVGGDSRWWLSHFRRSRVFAGTLGSLLRRDGYFTEQVSFAVSLLPLLLREEPTVVLCGDGTVLNVLWRARELLSRFRLSQCRLILSNSAPFLPPYCWCDFIHHTTERGLQEALERGGNPERHTCLPMGVQLPKDPPTDQGRQKAREQLGIPTHCTVVLSVGAIGLSHKRHEYLVEEFAALEERDVILLIVGQEEPGFVDFKTSAHARLGDRIRVIPNLSPSEVAICYAASDVFVLCSLNEGFGRVVAEAAGAALPVILNDHPALRQSFDGMAEFIDMEEQGGLANRLHRFVAGRALMAPQMLARERALHRFGWSTLAPQYSELFGRVKKLPLVTSRKQFKELICPE